MPRARRSLRSYNTRNSGDSLLYGTNSRPQRSRSREMKGRSSNGLEILKQQYKETPVSVQIVRSKPRDSRYSFIEEPMAEPMPSRSFSDFERESRRFDYNLEKVSAGGRFKTIEEYEMFVNEAEDEFNEKIRVFSERDEAAREYIAALQKEHEVEKQALIEENEKLRAKNEQPLLLNANLKLRQDLKDAHKMILELSRLISDDEVSKDSIKLLARRSGCQTPSKQIEEKVISTSEKTLEDILGVRMEKDSEGYKLSFCNKLKEKKICFGLKYEDEDKVKVSVLENNSNTDLDYLKEVDSLNVETMLSLFGETIQTVATE